MHCCDTLKGTSYFTNINFRWIIGQNLGCIIKGREEHTLLKAFCCTMLQDKVILVLSVTLLIFFLDKSMTKTKMLSFSVLLTAFLKRKGDILANCPWVDSSVLHSFLVIDDPGNRYFGPFTAGKHWKTLLH